MSGRLLCKVAQEAPNVLFVKEKQYASTTLLLPKHQDKYNTGTMTRIQRHLSRHLLVVASGLSGRAQHAAMSGKAMFQGVCRMTADVLDAIEFVLSETSTNGNKYKQPTFEAVQHPLLLEWDFERNPKDSIHPQNTTLGSRKLVHWVCHKCPKGQLHLYQMTPNNRTRNRGQGCPYCAGKQAYKCNSLEAHHPVISSEWDFEMNDMTLADVTSGSNKAVWWKNDVRGSWKQRVFERTHARKKPT